MKTARPYYYTMGDDRLGQDLGKAKCIRKKKKKSEEDAVSQQNTDTCPQENISTTLNHKKENPNKNICLASFK